MLNFIIGLIAIICAVAAIVFIAQKLYQLTRRAWDYFFGKAKTQNSQPDQHESTSEQHEQLSTQLNNAYSEPILQEVKASFPIKKLADPPKLTEVKWNDREGNPITTQITGVSGLPATLKTMADLPYMVYKPQMAESVKVKDEKGKIKITHELRLNIFVGALTSAQKNLSIHHPFYKKIIIEQYGSLPYPSPSDITELLTPEQVKEERNKLELELEQLNKPSTEIINYFSRSSASGEIIDLPYARRKPVKNKQSDGAYKLLKDNGKIVYKTEFCDKQNANLSIYDRDYLDLIQYDYGRIPYQHTEDQITDNQYLTLKQIEQKRSQVQWLNKNQQIEI